MFCRITPVRVARVDFLLDKLALLSIFFFRLFHPVASGWLHLPAFVSNGFSIHTDTPTYTGTFKVHSCFGMGRG